MGEVYKAKDTRLGREIAVKVLPEELAADGERLARFEQEARAASALNHPNILTVYDIGSESGRAYIAMELVQGKSLRDILDAGPPPLRKTLEIAAQVAEGLAKAHAAGIIHRDLKPENIMVSKDGYAKILDFGLAKLAEPGAEDLSNLPTSAPETSPGVILGTIGYMSPEQAAGRPVDFRSDQFSFGSILYEMVSGKRAFVRGSGPETLAAIIREDTEPLATVAPGIPVPFRWMIERCLAKDSDDRYASTRDLARDLSRLREGLGEASAASAAIVPSPARRRRLAAAFGAVLLLLGLAAGWLAWRRPPRIAPQNEWVRLTDFSDSVVDPAISPDGRMLAFLRGDDVFFTAGDLYVELLPAGDPVPLTHDGGRKLFPVFSPDGTRIAYTALDDKGGWNTYSVSVLGGAPQLYLPNSEDLHWIGGGRLLFSEIQSGIHMVLVTAREGRVDQRTIYDPPTDRGMAHLSALSPDGKQVVITEMGAQGEFLRCRLLPFDGSSRGVQIGPPGPCLNAAWSRDGRWIFLNVDTGDGFHLWRLRARNLRPEQVTFGPTRQNGIAVAPDGSLLTAVGTRTNSIWLHQPGSEDREITRQGNGYMPRFSPDGRRLYYLRDANDPVEGELMAVDLSDLHGESLFPGLGMLGYQISPDGRRVAFGRRDANGDPEVWLADLDRRTPPRRVPAPLPIDEAVFASPGELYVRALDHGKHYLERLRLDGSERRRVVSSPIAWINAISPDRRWIVVTVPWSAEEETATLRVVAYGPDGSRPTNVCTSCQVSWSPDGGTIYLQEAVVGTTKPVAIPLAAGRAFPDLPPEGFASSLDDAAKLPGARRVDLPESFSPRAGVWAKVRTVVQRNIYRIPVK